MKEAETIIVENSPRPAVMMLLDVRLLHGRGGLAATFNVKLRANMIAQRSVDDELISG